MSVNFMQKAIQCHTADFSLKPNNQNIITWYKSDIRLQFAFHLKPIFQRIYVPKCAKVLCLMAKSAKRISNTEPLRC